MKIKQTWALVANGGKARVVKFLGSDLDQEIIEINAERKKIGEIVTDKAGRSFSSMGKGRSGMELHSDPVRNTERLFAESLTNDLAKYVRKGQIDALIVAASPRTLGDLRSAYPTKLAEKVVKEIDKDYTQLPDKELSEVLCSMMNQKIILA